MVCFSCGYALGANVVVCPSCGKNQRAKSHLSVSSAVILFFLLAGLGGFIWFLYKLVNYKPDIRFDNITVLAQTLTIIGSFYLAYDLLGRAGGPLRWISLFVTSGLVGAIIAEPLMILYISIGDMRDAVRFLLVCALQGAYAGLLFGISGEVRKEPIFSWRKALIGIVLSIAFWATFFRIFTTIEAIGGYGVFVAAILILGIPTGFLIGGFHRFFRGKVAPGRPKVFSWIHFLKSLLLSSLLWGAIIWLVLTMPEMQTEDVVIGGVVVLVLAGLATAIPGGFARYVYWWVNHLPDKSVGAAGFVIALIGALLPLIQPINNILTALGGK